MDNLGLDNQNSQIFIIENTRSLNFKNFGYA